MYLQHFSGDVARALNRRAGRVPLLPRRRRLQWRRMELVGALALMLLAALLAGCGPKRVATPSQGHLEPKEADSGGGSAAGNRQAEIPATVDSPAPLPEPAARESGERYTVVVDQVPVRELLFAVARDADLEIDIVGDIGGRVTLNAQDEALPRLLERIARQADIRYELELGYIRIAADEPYLESYPVDYVNLTRSAESSVATATQIRSTGFGDGVGGGGGGSGGGGSNNSTTSLQNQSDNRFWETLERTLAGVIGVDGQREGNADGGGNAANGRRLMVNPEAGYVTARASQDEHQQVQRYLDRIMESARRQVLIEATVVEVELDERHQAGVDWAFVSQSVGGVDLLEQNLTAGQLGNAPNTLARLIDTDFADGRLQATVRALEAFGDVRVMSSPKIMALNNQLAILKVVDNRVYFTVDVETDQEEGLITRTFESEVNTVPVGLVMTVTPYIGADGEVLLNTRPTVSRIIDFVEDPNPELAAAGVTNSIPEIQVREMESLLRVDSGQVAVIGGLMQDTADRSERGIPGLQDLPLLGGLFSYRDEAVTKTELIIFLRPTVVDHANLNGDFERFRRHLERAPAADGSGAP